MELSGLLLTASSAFFLTQDPLPRGALPTAGWTRPHQSLVSKIPHRLAHRPVFQRYFLSGGSFLQHSSSLCRARLAILTTTDAKHTF